MNNRRPQRFVILLSVIGILIVGGAVLALQARQRQYALDRRLIAALEKSDPVEALALVNAGADPNTPYNPPPTPSLRSLWNHLLHRPSAPQHASPSAFVTACGGFWERRPWSLVPESPQLIQAMIRHGAKLNTKNNYAFTPLGWAVYSDHPKTVEILVKNGADVNARNKNNDTPLITGAAAEYKIVRLLVDHGADVHAKNNDGETPLHSATTSNSASLATVRLLVEHGADVNARDKDGETPLIYASCDTNFNIVRLLIAHGADVKAHDNEGDTPLLTACSRDIATVQLLLAHGANIRVQNKEGDTPLTVAVSATDTPASMVRLLLQHGAAPNLHARGSPSPLQSAKTNHRSDILALLRRAGAKD